MLKNETLNQLEDAFNKNEISDIMPELAPNVEIINLDLIRIYINDRIHPETVKDIIFNILHQNQEPGPIHLHIETAKSFKQVYYADIKTI